MIERSEIVVLGLDWDCDGSCDSRQVLSSYLSLMIYFYLILKLVFVCLDVFSANQLSG